MTNAMLHTKVYKQGKLTFYTRLRARSIEAAFNAAIATVADMAEPIGYDAYTSEQNKAVWSTFGASELYPNKGYWYVYTDKLATIEFTVTEVTSELTPSIY